MTQKIEEEIGELERRATVLRTKFFATVDALDTRGELAIEAADRVRRSVVPLAVAAGVVAVTVAGVAALWFASGPGRARLERRRRRRTWAALLSPFRRIVVVRPVERPSILGDLTSELLKMTARASLGETIERLAPLIVTRATRRLAS